jgi:hypothetical protein
MFLNAKVLEGQVRPSTFYDPGTGAPRSAYAVQMKVLDTDTKETYTIQLSDGFPELEEFKELRRQGAAPEAYEEVAARLEQNLPPEMTDLHLEVVKIKGKTAAFLTLVCRFARAAAPA